MLSNAEYIPEAVSGNFEIFFRGPGITQAVIDKGKVVMAFSQGVEMQLVFLGYGLFYFLCQNIHMLPHILCLRNRTRYIHPLQLIGLRYLYRRIEYTFFLFFLLFL